MSTSVFHMSELINGWFQVWAFWTFEVLHGSNVQTGRKFENPKARVILENLELLDSSVSKYRSTRT